jgi:7-carboxy-7-deazaguanine synthase
MISVKNIIVAYPTFTKDNCDVGYDPRILAVSEFFFDTIQGENFIGYPAAFLRLQNCTLGCKYCDTKEVWRFGNPYTFDELFALMDSYDLVSRLQNGQHLVLTGGSPLRQQTALIRFFQEFIGRYDFLPYIEVENECTVIPMQQMISFVKCWNNSPKLENSGNLRARRYQPAILRTLSSLNNSWFKFVITNEEDWDEIEKDFLDTNLIQMDQIVLMPLGATREELIQNREKVVEIAIKHNVRYSTREHIMLWDRKIGV